MMFVRILAALALAFMITVIVCPFFIRKMIKRQYGQQIREEGPGRHTAKAGTPTMGGLVIVIAAVVASILATGFSPLPLIVLPVFVGCGLLGFLDDYLKIVRKQSLGLKARSKLAGMVFISAVFILLLYLFGFYSALVSLPFLKLIIDMGFVYPLFVLLLITGFSNSVNLTDGIDGLAAGTVVFALAAYSYISYQAGLPALSAFCAALVGACLGFLVFNCHPARLFMGDVGSLSLGGALAAVAVLTKTEILVLVIGAVFVLEAFSVILQVFSFQLTGRRIFLMSPLHHHFELKGWSEWRVVSFFWLASMIFALIGLYQYGLMPAMP
jgi:phospho-N-acetylmuramoyl-pentapeptide-transferase